MPRKTIENTIGEKEFIRLYIDENLSFTDISDMYSISPGSLSVWAKSHGIVKSPEKIQEAKEKKFLERYGVTCPTKNKDIQEKVRQTNLERYGVAVSSQADSVKEKAKKTNLERYGVEWSLQSEQTREKSRQTCMEKYGVPTSALDPETRKKMQETCKEKYGGITPWASKEVRDKCLATTIELYGENPFDSEEIKKRRENTCLEKYGVKNIMQSEEGKTRFRENFSQKYGNTSPSAVNMPRETQEIMNSKEKFWEFMKGREYMAAIQLADELQCSESFFRKRAHLFEYPGFINTSSGEIEIKGILNGWGIECECTRAVIPPYEIDIYCPDYKIGIEYNGNYWHSDVYKDKNYHQKKSILAEENGIFVYHVFEYEWENKEMREKIINSLKNLFGKNSRKIYARNTIVKEVPQQERRDFLEANHLQGNGQSSVAYGLYFGDELVSIMTFCKPRFNMGIKKYDWELARFCCKADVTVTGAASKLFKHFLDSHQGTIVSYSNISKTRGTLYDMLGFKFDHISAPNYVWYRSENDSILTRYQTQMKNEVETMESQGYKKIYDSGNKIWVYKNNQ